ncbi:MAG: ribosomal protein S18-alanine N-acetyltransferase [Candidatus Goldbacteria bacterium]|nr:ribosomal protein S18-alanine N-acetyltransferase [Candidatus Goldiibacteriota bacterium]HPD18527.1 ribosomal protein S18-alanine N-acetyltransferase [Candidatus Goldiibacteriota bacterium]
MVIYRNAKRDDIDKILEIEKISYPLPWGRIAFECEISKLLTGAGIFLVAVDDENDKICGYVCANIIIDYVHILNLATAPEYRRKGIATEFIRKIEADALKRQIYGITLEVRETNEGAINLYKKSGFVIKGRREKYYEYKDDALIMWKILS